MKTNNLKERSKSKEKKLKQKKSKKVSNIKILKSKIKIKEQKIKEIDLTIEKPKKQSKIEIPPEEIVNIQFTKFFEKNKEEIPLTLENLEKTQNSTKLEKQVSSKSDFSSNSLNLDKNSEDNFNYISDKDKDKNKYLSNEPDYAEHFDQPPRMNLLNLGKNNSLFESKNVKFTESPQANLVKDSHIEKYTDVSKFKQNFSKEKNKNLGQEVKYTPSRS